MMVKYQVIYIQLESALNILKKLSNTQSLLLLRKYFNKYRINIKLINDQRALRRIKELLLLINKIHRCCKKKVEIKGLNKWREVVIMMKESENTTSKLKNIKEKHKEQLAKRKQTTDTLESKIKEKDEEVVLLKKNTNAIEVSIKDREQRTNSLKKAIDDSKESTNEDLVNSVKEEALKYKLQALRTENEKLKEEMKATQNNIAEFTNEMSKLFESMDFDSILYMTI